jgi:hypothetical protein
VRLQTPLVDIQTIAAGGGSILRFADGRLQVGPASAGADPGPACYRRNGPATVTDCNVVLGRIPPARFPRVFGPTGAEPIDAAASRARLAELAAASGLGYSVESLAEAFLEVAVARMANAIRELALHHGHDPAQFALLCFGGAAGQHACAVANLLGAEEVLLHPLAGVLSAYGIGLTSRRAIRRRTVERPLDESGHAEALATIAALDREAREDLLRQAVAADRIDVRLSAHVRLAGSDTSIELPWQGPGPLRAEFFASHRQLYGFADEHAQLVIASVMAEAIERVDANANTGLRRAPRPGFGPKRRREPVPGGSHSPSMARDALLTGIRKEPATRVHANASVDSLDCLGHHARDDELRMLVREAVELTVRREELGAQRPRFLPRQFDGRVRTGEPRVRAEPNIDSIRSHALPQQVLARLPVESLDHRARLGVAGFVQRPFHRPAADRAAARQADAIGREHACQRVQEHFFHAEQAGDGACMLAGGAAKAQQCESRGIVAMMQRQLADSVRHAGDGHLEECLGQRLD